MKRSGAATTAVALVVFIVACEKSPPPPAERAAAPAAPAAVAGPPSEALLHPDPSKVDVTGPDSFAVHVVTSKGAFDLKIHRDWSPKGSDHLYYLISNNFYDGIRFYRVINGFMAQFGFPGDTAVGRIWNQRIILDDPVTHHNTRGMLTYATAGANTRTTQLFINMVDNSRLDATGFSPLGEVTSGMAAVDSLYNGYGDAGPDQTRFGHEGNSYVIREFPKLDYIVTARVTQEWKKTK